jgi:hypothetical protein
MHKLINISIAFSLLLILTGCNSLLNSSLENGGYRIAQVREDQSLQEGMGKLMGVVKDAKTGERLEKGEVFIFTLNKRFAFNKDGSFSELIPAGKYAVSIESEGYNSVTTSNLLIRTKTSTYLDVQLFSTANAGASGPTN